MTTVHRQRRRAKEFTNPEVRPDAPTLIEALESDGFHAGELAAARLAAGVQSALAACLEAADMSQADLAHSLGITASAVSQVLADGNVRIGTIGRYARAMGYQASLCVYPVEPARPSISNPLPANVLSAAITKNWRVIEASADRHVDAMSQSVMPRHAVFRNVKMWSDDPLAAAPNG